MDMIKIPAFGEAGCIENRENDSARVFVIPNVEESAFTAYCTLFENGGFAKKEEYRQGTHRFAAYAKGNCGLFLNYFGAVRELYIVAEEDCLYFSYSDEPRSASVSAQITQIELEDFGMSYVIRLPDGRFIVIDGGRNFESDADRLFQCLKKGASDEKPVIAAWILSHPHSDHFHCFITFMDRHSDEVVIEKFLMNFPERDDVEHYPKLQIPINPVWGDLSGYTNIPLMQERIAATNAPVYMVHTGQKYRIGDAACEILACMDDTIHLSDNINATSLVIRMELAGQVILWTTDAAFSIAKLPEKYGTYLKSDILQIPHHGFQSGTAQGEIRGYELIRPKVCFLPVSDYNAYITFCTYREGARYLMSKAGVDEIITGTPQRTITLPYNAPAYAKLELERKYLSGRDSAGACAWFFSELSTACPEDFEFTLLNTTHVVATVWIELFFEDPTQKVRYIKAEVGKTCMRRLCIVGDEVDGDAIPLSSLTLKKMGVPENVPFAVRFLCNVPIVVSHKNHTASYRSSVNR